MSASNSVVYEPLLWSFRFAETCPIHRQRLAVNCVNCRSTVTPLAAFSAPGHCHKCGLWLGGVAGDSAITAGNDFRVSTVDVKSLRRNPRRFAAIEAGDAQRGLLAQHAVLRRGGVPLASCAVDQLAMFILFLTSVDTCVLPLLSTQIEEKP